MGGVICYLRLLIFLLEILIPACASSSPAFLMMYSANKLNKQGNNIQPWRTPFPIWNQSAVPCPVLTLASWPVYRFQEAGQVVWYSHPFQNFSQFIVIHTVKGFGIVNKAEIVLKWMISKMCIFSSPSCFYHDWDFDYCLWEIEGEGGWEWYCEGCPLFLRADGLECIFW